MLCPPARLNSIHKHYLFFSLSSFLPLACISNGRKTFPNLLTSSCFVYGSHSWRRGGGILHLSCPYVLSFISSVVGISWQNWRSRSRRPPRERCECVVQIKFYHLFRSLVGFVDLLFLRLDGENLISKIGNLLVVPHKGYRWKLL